jgi:hypothetical protein
MKKFIEKLSSVYLPKFVIVLLLLLSVIFNLASILLSPRDGLNDWFVNFFQNMGVDFLGAIVTYFLLENVIGGWKEKLQEEREQALEIEEMKKRRIEQQILAYQELKSSINAQETQLIVEKMSLLDLFKDYKLSDMQLNKLSFNNVNWTGSSLEKITFISSAFKNCSFENSRLVKVSFVLSELNHIVFNNALLFDVDFASSHMIRPHFTGCRFRDCVLADIKIYNGRFDDADLPYSDFSNSNLEGSSFVNSNLKGVNFKGARLYNVNFGGADVQDVLMDVFTILPNGEQWKNGVELTIYSGK